MVQEFGIINYNLWTWTILYGATLVWGSAAAFYTWLYCLGDIKHLPEKLRESKKRIMEIEERRRKAEAERKAKG
ncbi:MAG: hypothetical protein QXJ75_03715 [Candidatus Bathyarchaeia archaeon]